MSQRARCSSRSMVLSMSGFVVRGLIVHSRATVRPSRTVVLGAAKPSATARAPSRPSASSSAPARRKQTMARLAGETTSQPPRARASASACSASAIPCCDRGLERVEAEDAQRQPELERARAAGELRAALAELDDAAAGVAQVGAVERERVLEQAGLADEHGADLVGLEEPLVRVEHERVGALDAGEEVRLREAGGRAVGAVDVEPQALAVGEVGEVVERVDGAGARRAGGADDARTGSGRPRGRGGSRRRSRPAGAGAAGSALSTRRFAGLKPSTRQALVTAACVCSET